MHRVEEIMRHWLGIMIVLTLLGATAAVFVLGPRRARTTGHPSELAQLRGLLAALVAYSQNNQGALPPPDQTRKLLIRDGYAPSEIFETSSLQPDEPVFLSMGGYSNTGTGLKSPVPAETPLVYTNPAISHGQRAWVLYQDNRIDLLEGKALQRFFDIYASAARPIH